jgi:hypothetical protein
MGMTIMLVRTVQSQIILIYIYIYICYDLTSIVFFYNFSLLFTFSEKKTKLLIIEFGFQ